MKRVRKTNNIVYLFFLAILLVVANIYLTIQNRKTFQILEEKPYDIVVANISTDQAEVYWKTKSKNIEVLTYKEKWSTAPYKNEKNFRLYTDISKGEDLYKSTISNLRPNTKYVFRINSPEHIWNYNLTFTTKNIDEQVKLPQIETGSSDPGDFVLIDAEGEKYMVFANRNTNWALDLKGKDYNETKYAQYIPKFELKQRLSSALNNSVYAAAGANCMTNVKIKDNRYLPTLNQSLALTEGGRFSYCKGDYLRECYADVYCKSIDAGLNPAISLTVWMHESAASMYAKYPVVEDFGIHLPGWTNDFTRQLNYFLNNVATESYANNWFDEACKRRANKSDAEIDRLKKKYAPEHIWATKYWRGYVCTEDDTGIAAGVAYIGYLEEMFYQMTGKDLPNWPWRVGSNSTACDRSNETRNTKYRTCSGESGDSTPTDPLHDIDDCSFDPPGKKDIKIGEKCTDGGGCECYDGAFTMDNYIKDVPCGKKCEKNGNNDDDNNTGDGNKDQMIITDQDRKCEDPNGCICLYDKEGNNYKTKLNAKYGQICKTDKTVIDDPDAGKTVLEVTDEDQYCKSTKGCVCYWNNKEVREEVENGYTCTVDGEIIKTENICCLENDKLSTKMPYNCSGVFREDIPIQNCKNTNVKYELKKGVSFINPVEALDTEETLHPKTAYDLIEMSDKRVIAVGEYKSGEWIQVVKYEGGKIYGNDFQLDSNKSYMVISLQEAVFNVSGYRLEQLDILEMSGWNLVPSSVFDSKGRTSYEVLQNLEFNKVKQIGQWQDHKGLFDYTFKDEKNNIFGEELKIDKQSGIFIKVLQ